MDFQPHFMAGRALRKVDKGHWERRVRPSVVPKVRPSCCICDFVAEEQRSLIHADEVWAFPGPPKVILADVRPLCVYCHEAKDYADLLRRIQLGTAGPSRSDLVMTHYCSVNGCGEDDFQADIAAATVKVWELENLYGADPVLEIDYGRWARPAHRPQMSAVQKRALRELFAKNDRLIYLDGIRLVNYASAVARLQSLSLNERGAALAELLGMDGNNFDDDFDDDDILTERDEGLQWE